MGRESDLELSWYGDASLVLRCRDAAIAFDPFDGLPVGAIRHPQQQLPNESAYAMADGVFVTHGHFDHIFHIPRIDFNREIPIFCTKTPGRTLKNKGVPESRIRTIAPGWEGTVGPFHVKAWQGRHCRFDAALVARTILRPGFFRHPGHLARLLWLDISYREGGEILFYELCCEGTRIQIMGSMNLAKNVEYPTGADVLILPLQGRSDQDIYALNLVERLKPKKILLDHYDNAFPPMSDDINVTGFIKNVELRFGIPCSPLEKGRTVTLKTQIPGEEEIYGKTVQETLGRPA